LDVKSSQPFPVLKASRKKKTGLVMTTTVCELENGHRNSEFSHEQW